ADMLRRQQAEAVVAARTRIVAGAVSMVQLALHQLSEQRIVELDEERKAAMVSNLLVVLCGEQRAQPGVNAGTLYQQGLGRAQELPAADQPGALREPREVGGRRPAERERSNRVPLVGRSPESRTRPAAEGGAAVTRPPLDLAGETGVALPCTGPSGDLPREGRVSRVPWLPVVGLAAVKLAVPLVFAGRYGWHGDELYYLASGRHLELGYVDYPPVPPAIARLVQVVAPDSVVALRFPGILAGALVVVLAALIARELGGGRRAQVLAALTVVISPVFLGGNFIFSTVDFDQLVWALLLWLVARVLAGRDPRLWLLAGLVLGVGLETKYTVAALAVALSPGLLFPPAPPPPPPRWAR